MTNKLKLALVGCGQIARLHLDGINQDAPRIQVTATIDPDPKRAQAFADETGATAYTSLAEALEKGDFDAVDIMVPHDLHEDLACMTLAAGKHLMLEKPMAPTLDACQRIMDAAAEAQANHPGLVFMVAENSQYWPEVVRAKELIDQGEIGEIVTARAAFHWRVDMSAYSGPDGWRSSNEKSGGGVAMDGGAHWIRPLRMWMGEIKEVIGTLGYVIPGMDDESLVRSLLRFESGTVAVFDCISMASVLAPDDLWRITGTKGEIVIRAERDTGVLLYNDEHPDGTQMAEPWGYPRSFGLELQDFSHAVLDGTPLAAGPEESLGELRTALALYRSAESGKWESVWD